ncbi:MULTISPECIES: DUF6682 family protein [Pseudomonadota]|uniref:phage adaptor protein n=1 Tax=Pseudomonadota TaxID=1224 RepID=UPI0022FEAA6B|nr:MULTISPECIES: DUF6682 family protein [unclassified Cobetia]MDA5564365.1 hypothetical protein [Cobetia sp. MMG027]MDH2289984.1 hypothetical protein [Cobetia sp. 10Alg 146]MDH2296024.1 hypothetical protein [Cobetia sp. 1AS1]
MPITARDVITRVRDTTLDNTEGGVRWLDDELIRYINDASQAIVQLKPSAHPVNTTMLMSPGTLQQAPQGAIVVIDVVRNVNGSSIRRIDRDVLDIGHPDWHLMNQQPSVRHYMLEAHDPTRFYVYPPSDGSGSINLIYSAEPPMVNSLDSTLPLAATYLNAYTDYVLYRAYSKDAEFAANREQAGWYYQAFTQGLGVRMQTERNAQGEDPTPGAP